LTPAFHSNHDEWQQIFPQLFKNGTTNRRREREEVGADFMFYNRHFVKLGQPYALVDFNPTSHLALTPVRRLRIWAQSGESGEVVLHTLTL
jgi:hypothetical protein